jgi:hypothetical protein
VERYLALSATEEEVAAAQARRDERADERAADIQLDEAAAAAADREEGTA